MRALLCIALVLCMASPAGASTGFRFAPGVAADVDAMAPDPSGGWWVMGESGDDAGVARITPAGTLDPAFAGDGTTVVGVSTRSQELRAVLPAGGGGAFVAGCAQPATGPDPCDGFVLRLGADGQPDPAFGVNGIATVRTGTGYERVDAARSLPGGGLILAGEDGRGLFLARLSADGRLDPRVQRPFPRHRQFFPDDLVPDGHGGWVVTADVVMSGHEGGADTREFDIGVGRVDGRGRPRGFGIVYVGLGSERGRPDYDFGIAGAMRGGRFILAGTDEDDHPEVVRLDRRGRVSRLWRGPRAGEESDAAVDARGRTWVATSDGRRTRVWRLSAAGRPGAPRVVDLGRRHEIVRAIEPAGRGAVLAVVTGGSMLFAGDIVIARI